MLSGISSAPASPIAPVPAVSRVRRPTWLTLAACAFLAFVAFLIGPGTAAKPQDDDIMSVRRLTDFSGLEEFPAIAPDLKSVARG